MSAENIQAAFLEQIKKQLPSNTSFADELAELLNVSRDSAYRRIRGETVLSLDEAKILSHKFNVSLDAFFGTPSEFITFRHLIVNHRPQTFKKWLESMYANLEMIAGFTGKKQISFTAKDIPIFHYFNYPRLSAFKMFFWMKSLLNYTEFQNLNYSSKFVLQKHLALGQKIWKTYNAIPSVEIWADETANVTLKQLEFYNESGFFNSSKDIEGILEDYSNLIHDIRQSASSGMKQDGIEYTLYKNEILIADNTVLFRMDEKRVVYISHNITELLMTTHKEFCQQTELFINNLQNKSILISTTGERERNKFFNNLKEKIEVARKKIV